MGPSLTLAYCGNRNQLRFLIKRQEPAEVHLIDLIHARLWRVLRSKVEGKTQNGQKGRICSILNLWSTENEKLDNLDLHFLGLKVGSEIQGSVISEKVDDIPTFQKVGNSAGSRAMGEWGQIRGLQGRCRIGQDRVCR